MTIRASVFAALLAACSSASMAGMEPDHIESFSFMTRDVSQETLREIASRVATKHELAPVEIKRRDPVPEMIESRSWSSAGAMSLFSRYLAPPDCVIAEFRIRGSDVPRKAAAMREDLQQGLTADLAHKVQLHDHPSCDVDLSPTLQHR